ncbi:exodeoxyribonuclease III [Loigolactobacillus backii]|uniref:Exodeoxyribonuclease III n=1 Tax=Loigolactobacillus backii TaxID=375175 RepID=A0A192H4Z2_9LACO|nr:exodeoxyribonuclease III [Loigolactobacillus backii]ANK59947.1 exodeoxyribonuclease III [Loigolactobacillus backii]ANK63282.1 exodeoxyribonuclease III [Loigolactobacillus backii]ANK64881.1 exodeoxyribonuclease III [Loigolactobacillus backii]ANK66672.1 exodeoxyribonuclease III [Loigolactobacillus backii]ANK69712.1 exodeoxyribonuclease III [Loigolactobacillus backii]
MKFISWNVNGLRAILKKNFMDVFEEQDADFFCVQETKLQAGQVDLELPGYHQYWNYADRKGYSGTAIFTKHEPLTVRYGMDIDEHDHEGRLITLEYPDFYVVTCYTPNSQTKLKRLDYRMRWDTAFRNYVTELYKVKSVIFCGDLNVAHEAIDLKNDQSNHHNAGFSDEEREQFTQLLKAGFTDSFRYFYPDQTGSYSWWSYRFNARANNAGWRIDYFVTSNDLQPKLTRASILNDIMGSDHCPVVLETN